MVLLASYVRLLIGLVKLYRGTELSYTKKSVSPPGGTFDLPTGNGPTIFAGHDSWVVIVGVRLRTVYAHLPALVFRKFPEVSPTFLLYFRISAFRRIFKSNGVNRLPEEGLISRYGSTTSNRFFGNKEDMRICWVLWMNKSTRIGEHCAILVLIVLRTVFIGK